MKADRKSFPPPAQERLKGVEEGLKKIAKSEADYIKATAELAQRVFANPMVQEIWKKMNQKEK